MNESKKIMQKYLSTSIALSKALTNAYSTSFSLGIKALDKPLRSPIYSIYGFVRLADEIVDTFHEHDKQQLLEDLKLETTECIKRGLSLNPVMHAFQETVNKYDIDQELIDAFLRSMELDLVNKKYPRQLYDDYVFGSAEAVGLMCLKVFTKGDAEQYNELRAPAQSLGAAFQKVNFLRDMRSDFKERGRTYFPDVDYNEFSEAQKIEIENEIAEDFKKAYPGIKALPKSARLGVFSAYLYYLALFEKLRAAPIDMIKTGRLRINNARKLAILANSILKDRLNLI